MTGVITRGAQPLLSLCSPVNLSKHNIYALFGRLKQFFSCFSAPYLMHHSVNKQNTAYLHHFDMFVEVEVEYSLTTQLDLDLWPACSIP